LTWQTDNTFVALNGNICGIREIILQFYMSAFSLLTGKYFELKFLFNASVNGGLSWLGSFVLGPKVIESRWTSNPGIHPILQ
jgi:hypothetical protein